MIEKLVNEVVTFYRNLMAQTLVGPRSNLSEVVIYIFLFFFSSLSIANSLYPLPSLQQEAQFEHLLKDLRCLVCQNQDLADSNAPLAQDLRSQVYSMVKEGKTDSEIHTYLTARYGDFILFKPPLKGVTVLLWFGPLLFLVCGVIIFWRTCLRRRVAHE